MLSPCRFGHPESPFLNEVIVVKQWKQCFAIVTFLSLIALPPAGFTLAQESTETTVPPAEVTVDVGEAEATSETTSEAASETASETAAEPAGLTDAQIADSYGAHNAWMLVCCALVLFMTAPGLAMFYGGLVRRKNVLSVMMQCIFLMGLMTVIWALYGYSLAFGPTEAGSWIGNFDYAFMNGVAREWDDTLNAPVTPMAGSMPRLTHMLFQGMFFIITPALICGAFAERMKFSAMVIYSILWGTFIYCPLCHWVWAEGPLSYFAGDKALFGGMAGSVPGRRTAW